MEKMNMRRIEKEDLKSIVEAGFSIKGCPATPTGNFAETPMLSGTTA